MWLCDRSIWVSGLGGFVCGGFVLICTTVYDNVSLSVVSWYQVNILGYIGHSSRKIADVDSSDDFCLLCPFCYPGLSGLCWLIVLCPMLGSA